MASFTSLLNDVYTITNRPDLIAETKLAVKQATLKMHQSDYYPKDLFETGIAWNPHICGSEFDIPSSLYSL